MKIGIISSYAWVKIANNYGALLQYYALQKYLKQRGHDVYWIRFILKDSFLKVLLRELYHNKSIKKLIYFINCHIEFMKFIKTYLSTSTKVYREIKILDENDYDYFIAGSDQVWGGTIKENYLTFVVDKPKIAYAASFGKNQLSEEHANIIAPWLKTFDKISVRESSGVDICKNMGIKAIHVLDPTLLLSIKDYPASYNILKEKYIYSYFLNAKTIDDLYFSKIENFIDKKAIHYYVTAIQGTEKFIPSKYLVYPKPTDWLSYYRYSEYVITNTFHGTVFALIYHKPFISILQKGTLQCQNSRIYSLLNMFDLTDRIWDGTHDIEEIIDRPIDWDFIETKRNIYIKRTDKFFQDCGL